MYEEQSIDTTVLVENCCISWTGGKDCNLALLEAWRDPSLHVTDLVVFIPESKIDCFEAHPIRIMRQQSESINLPLRIMVLPSSSSYRDGYCDAFKTLHNDYKISVICTGDYDLVGNSHRNWMDECAEIADCGIRVYLPLWKADRDKTLSRLLDESFVAIFSCVKSPWLNESWCGKYLDYDAYEQMLTISKSKLYDDDDDDGTGTEIQNLTPNDPRRKPFDLCGENGEYHTMIVDGPFYKYKMKIIAVRTGHNSKLDNNNKNNNSNEEYDTTTTKNIIKPKSVVTEKAKDGEDRWWTYDGQIMWTLGDDFDIIKIRKEI